MSATKIIAITSGKGGVGKTSLTINLGIALAQHHKVCLFDADTNMANINIMLRMAPACTLEHVARGEKAIDDIVLHKAGMDIIPGASGITDFIYLTAEQQQQLIQAVSSLEKKYDYMLVDTGAGIHESVLGFIESAHQCLIILTPEPTSLTDAFTLLRILKKRDYKKAVNVVVNSARSELNARNVVNRFAAAVNKYIGYRINYLGFINHDANMTDAITLQKPILLHNPRSIASQCFLTLARNVQRVTGKQTEDTSLSELLTTQARMANMPSFSLPAKHTKAFDKKPARAGVDDFKQQLKTLIEDPAVSKQSLDDMFSYMLQAYEQRFNEYPQHPIDSLNHYLEHNKIPQNRLNDLLMTLQLFYQGKMSEEDREIHGQHLRQWINSYVDQFKSFPFDAIYTLYQYLELETVPSAQLRELLKTLYLIYQDRYSSEQSETEDARNLLYCNELNQTDMERMVKSLQDKLLHNLWKRMSQQPTAQTNSTDAEQTTDSENYSIMDSIRYASLTDD
jgi:MinD-like ATPase involved in chromosome partitioning or flagellar assembly